VSISLKGRIPVPDNDKALKPEDLTRLFVERANEADAAGIAALYEENAVMAYPPGSQTTGRDAIRALWEKVLANAPHFEPEAPLPTLISGDIALTATAPKDGAGARAQVARRQPDGTWLRPARVHAAGRLTSIRPADQRSRAGWSAWMAARCACGPPARRSADHARR
jgi:ketosteroid isomerase-like protein